MGHKLLKFYSLIVVVFFAFLTTKAINCFLVLPIIIDLTLDLFNIKKRESSMLSPGDSVKFKAVNKKDLLTFKNE